MKKVFAGILVVLMMSVCACAFAFSVKGLAPETCDMHNFRTGISVGRKGGAKISGVPDVLQNSVVIRVMKKSPPTHISFVTNADAMVYVCVNSKAAKPAWLDSWFETDMAIKCTKPDSEYKVYSKRFLQGKVSFECAGYDYFVIVRELTMKFPLIGWETLSYDMPHLEELMKLAREYDVNHIELSHDLVHHAWQVLDDDKRRADVNRLIDLAHAYGVPQVMVWTHEIEKEDMPEEFRAPEGHPAAGHADGNNPKLWEWVKERYEKLFSPGTGCPEVDGIVLTLSETDDNVYQHGPEKRSEPSEEFKHDGFTREESVAKLIKTVKEVCDKYDKRLIVRTWGASWDKYEQPVIQNGFIMNNDPQVWIMNKNVGGIDWPFMDVKQPLISQVPKGFTQIIEFDLGAEYFHKSKSTGIMTSYVKEHWNYGLKHGAVGAVARIGRNDSSTYYSPNRINMYTFSKIIKNPDADPAKLNLEWCEKMFPKDAAADIADSYDDPASKWDGDTRYLMWKATRPRECKMSVDDALEIGYKAMEKINKHQKELEKQNLLKPNENTNDYQTLRSGIMHSIVLLGDMKGKQTEVVDPR